MNMATVSVILLALTLLTAIAILIVLLTRRSAPAPPIDIGDLKGGLGEVKGATQELSSSVKSLIGSVESSLHTGESSVSGKLGKVAEGLTKVLQAEQQVAELAKDVVSFKELLRAPKARGGMGEMMLGQLLGNVLPSEHYEMQYSLGSERVDAIIKTPEGLVPVDSKFPLPAFEKLLAEETDDGRRRARKEFLRDVKSRIDEIRGKYIKPELGTVDFALMYIPAENVYYEAINPGPEGESILDYSLEHKVIPVSPSTFYAYLAALAYGFRGMKVAKHAEEIRNQLAGLAKDLSAAQGDFDTLGKQLDWARENYEKTGRHFAAFAMKLQQYEQLSSIEGEGELEE